jgi:hypothetical protein
MALKSNLTEYFDDTPEEETEGYKNDVFIQLVLD